MASSFLMQESYGNALAELAFLALLISTWTQRRHQSAITYLIEENRVLRAQLPKRLRLTDDQRRRLALKGKPLGRRMLAAIANIPTPDTILRWYRRLVAAKYDGSRKRNRGRPPTPPDVAQLVVAMARDNPTWGYTRIRGALADLGHDIGRNTIKRILRDHGLEPAPGRTTPWRTFLQAHWQHIAAADFFNVEVLTPFGLVRYSVFFVIRLRDRVVHIAGISSQPHGEWMLQLARNLTDPIDGFLGDVRKLITDRDPLYTAAFRKLLTDSGTENIRLD